MSQGSEQFDSGLLCVCNADNDATGDDKLVVASLDGTLRVYQPRPEGFSPSHLVVERDLGEPIVQVGSGRVVSNSPHKHLVVLHPRRLAVYTLSQVSGVKEVDHGAMATLSQVYQHVLKRTAANMCIGSFGGVSKDYVCVQSLDGVLSVFEQDLASFSRYLPNVLLPGPLCYCKTADCLLTISASCLLTCYRYTGLAMATGSDRNASGSTSQGTGRRLSPDWSVDLGEQVRDLFVEESGDLAKIMVLGQRSLFCISLDGTISFAKKFETRPSCFKPYATKLVKCADKEPEHHIMTLVAFHRHHTLAILDDTRLAWAAGLPAGAAMAIDVMQMRTADGTSTMRGVIVTLEEDGRLACLYLGTEPLEGAQDAMSLRRQEDMQKHEEDLRSLRSFIKATEDNENKDELHKMVCTDLSMKGVVALSSEVPSKEIASAVSDTDIEEPLPQKCAVLTLTIEAPQRQAVHDVAITVRCQAPMAVDPPGIVVSHVTPDSPSVLRFRFFIMGDGLVCDNSAVVVASFTSATGYPNMIPYTVRLPFALFVEGGMPEKEATCKITIDSNQPCADLHELFKDVPEKEELAQNSVAFDMTCGQTVSVMSSRTSQRYRIQCNDFPSMWLVLTELINRLHHLLGDTVNDKGEPFLLELKENLPLAEYYALMDEHLECRIKLQQCYQQLEERATEFRVLQKRLLLRIKDKTPTPLHHLDMLHSRSYDLLMALCGEEEILRTHLHQAALRLSAGTRAMALLIRLYAKIPADQLEILHSVLSPQVPGPSDPVGWQEITDVALVQMLRTCLSSSEREQDVTIPAMEMPESNVRLKKHLSHFIVRLSKENLKLTVDGEPPSKARGKQAP